MFGMFYSISLAQIWGVYQEGCVLGCAKFLKRNSKLQKILHILLYIIKHINSFIVNSKCIDAADRR